MLQRHQTFRVLTKRGSSISWENLKTILTWAGLILAVLLPFGGIVWGLSAELMAQKKELEFLKHEMESLHGQIERLERLAVQREYRETITHPPAPDQPLRENRIAGGEASAQRATSEPNDPPPSSSNPRAFDAGLNNTMVEWVKSLIVPYYKFALTRNPALQNQTHKVTVVFLVSDENTISGLSIIVPPLLAELQMRLKETMPYHKLPVDARGYYFDQDIYLGSEGR